MKKIGWLGSDSIDEPIILTGDANGPSDANTVSAVHAGGIQYPFGDLVEGELLSVSGGQIVAGGIFPTSISGDANGPLGATEVTAIHADGVPYTWGVLVNNQALVVSGGSIVAGGTLTLAGDATGAIGTNEVRAIHESGNTKLTFGAVADEQVLVRSGTNLIGRTLNDIPRVVTTTFSFNSGALNIGTSSLPSTAIVVEVQCVITTVFNSATSTVSVGWVGTPAGLMSTGETTPTALNTYITHRVVTGAANQQLQLTVTQAGATQGQGRVVVHYILS